MSILSVDNISPIGSGTSVTVNSAATLVLNNINSTGVVTATTFVGALTGTASGNPTMSSGADNRVITASSASAIQGEANLTFNGSALVLDNPNGANYFEIGSDSSNQYSIIDLKGDTTYTDYAFRIMRVNSGANAESQLLHRGTGHFTIKTAEAADILFYTAGNERLRITSDGQLIHKANKASGYIAEFHQDHASNSGQILIDSPANNDGRPAFIDLSRAGTLQWSIGQGYNHSGGAFHFATSSLGAGITGSKLTITSAGKVGINQSSPQTGLHINQDWVASYGSISVEGGNNALVGLGLRSSGTYKAALIWRDGSSGDYLELATQSTSNPILFKPNNTERVRVQDGGLKLNGGSYIMEVSAGHGAPNNNNKQMDQRRWMWYGTSSSTHTVARVAKASSGSPGDGDSYLAAFIVTYTTRSMYGFNSDGGYSVMKMRTGRINGNNNTVHFSTEKDSMGDGSGSQNPTIVFTDEGSGVVRISITNPSSTHSFGEINLMTYDCRITLPSG